MKRIRETLAKIFGFRIISNYTYRTLIADREYMKYYRDEYLQTKSQLIRNNKKIKWQDTEVHKQIKPLS
jgi:hypothetical protein